MNIQLSEHFTYKKLIKFTFPTIIMIYLLPIIWGLDGIWLAVVFAEILSLIVCIMCLLLNRKKYKYT